MFDKHIALSIEGVHYDCWIAETPEERQSGLESWTGLGPQEGMLFPFGGGTANVWMGRVTFPLTFIFLDGQRRPMSVVRNVQPGDRRVFTVPGCWGVVEIAGSWK